MADKTITELELADAVSDSDLFAKDELAETKAISWLSMKGELKEYFDTVYTSGWDLFNTKWSDHLIKDSGWVRGDTFSWQSGEVYKGAYNELVNQFVVGLSPEVDTINGLAVVYYRTAKNYKICLPDQEQSIIELFNSVGVAWYYILDADNTRFKLPRTQYGFNGIRNYAGDYIEPTLPNITGVASSATYGTQPPNGALSTTGGSSNQSGSSAYQRNGSINFNASWSNPIYKDGATVQPPATEMYLYFYVGNSVQNQDLIDVGQIAEALDNKVDLDLGNISNQGRDNLLSFLTALPQTADPNKIGYLGDIAGSGAQTLPNGGTYIYLSLAYNSSTSAAYGGAYNIYGIAAGGTTPPAPTTGNANAYHLFYLRIA